MRYNQDIITKIDNEHITELANRAGCSINNEESERFLFKVCAAVIEEAAHIDAEDWEYEMLDDRHAVASQIAETAASVYTTTMWREFVGTAAWLVDVEESQLTDMESGAYRRLAEIARLLVKSLATEIAESRIETCSEYGEQMCGTEQCVCEVTV